MNKKARFLVVPLILVMIIALVMFQTKVRSDHYVNVSDGGTIINVNEGSTFLVNISINNTDISGDANITELNISLGTLSFVTGTNGTEVNATFSNITNVLNWANPSGLVMNVSKKYFWFNISLATYGNYSINITTTNLTGSFNSSLQIVVNDITAPQLNFSSQTESDGSYFSRRNIVVNVSAGDSGTGLKNVTIRLYNSTYSEINSTNTSLANLYYDFSVSSDGRYYFNATVADNAGNYNMSPTREVNVDTVIPIITSLDDGSIDTDSAVISWTTSGDYSNSTVYYDSSDTSPESGADYTKTDSSFETSHSVTLTGLSDETTYYYEVKSCDRAGNCNTTNKDNSFTTDANDGSGNDNGGGDDDDVVTSFWTYTSSDNNKEFSEKGLISRLLAKGERFKIKINNELHYVGVIRVRTSSATINVSSTPQQATINLRESKRFDVNNDSFYDINVTLHNIVNSSSANLSIIYIRESKNASSSLNGNITTSGNGTLTGQANNSIVLDEENDEETNQSKWWIILIAIVVGVILIAGIAYIIVTKKHKHVVIKKNVKVKHP